MGDVIGSLFSIVWLIIIFGFIKNATGKGKGISLKNAEKWLEKFTGNNEKPKSIEINEDYEPEQKAQAGRKLKPGEARPGRSSLRETSALSDTMVEDRQHDWLARQIREEKKRVVWNNFVDLGAAHDEACAAELNRKDHKMHHQSYVVDDGFTDN